MFKQKLNYGCGLYAVANALNISNFITEKRLEQSKEGNNIFQLSSWLNEDGYGCFITPYYYNALGSPLPKEWISFKPEGSDIKKNEYMALLIKVASKNIKNGSHLIGALLNTEGKLITYDYDIKLTTFQQLQSDYKTIYGIYYFNTFKPNTVLYRVLDEELYKG